MDPDGRFVDGGIVEGIALLSLISIIGGLGLSTYGALSDSPNSITYIEAGMGLQAAGIGIGGSFPMGQSNVFTGQSNRLQIKNEPLVYKNTSKSNSVPKPKENKVENVNTHKNNNDYVGNFAIYEIKTNGETYKYGVADMDRVTKSSGNPTRLHQQVRKLNTQDTKARGDILEYLYGTSKADAKKIENLYIQNYYNANSTVPIGNQKSFKIK